MRSTIRLNGKATFLSVTVTLVALAGVAGWLKWSAEQSVAQPSARVEVPEKRTANSRTYRNASGSYTTEFFDQQLHYKDAAGRIKPIDTSLETAADGYVSNANALKAYLAGERIDQVAFSFLKHLAGYATGRSLSYNELEFLKERGLELKPAGYPMQDLVRFVIQSELFLEK